LLTQEEKKHANTRVLHAGAVDKSTRSSRANVMIIHDAAGSNAKEATLVMKNSALERHLHSEHAGHLHADNAHVILNFHNDAALSLSGQGSHIQAVLEKGMTLTHLQETQTPEKLQAHLKALQADTAATDTVQEHATQTTSSFSASPSSLRQESFLAYERPEEGATTPVDKPTASLHLTTPVHAKTIHVACS